MNKQTIIFMLLGVTLVSTLGVSTAVAEENQIPPWIKGVFAYYVDDKITDAELIDALEFLADEGILKIGNAKYESFSKEKFPDTGGFNPAWLEGERDVIKKSCLESKQMGYESAYCKYVQ